MIVQRRIYDKLFFMSLWNSDRKNSLVIVSFFDDIASPVVHLIVKLHFIQVRFVYRIDLFVVAFNLFLNRHFHLLFKFKFSLHFN